MTGSRARARHQWQTYIYSTRTSTVRVRSYLVGGVGGAGGFSLSSRIKSSKDLFGRSRSNTLSSALITFPVDQFSHMSAMSLKNGMELAISPDFRLASSSSVTKVICGGSPLSRVRASISSCPVGENSINVTNSGASGKG